jgi:hypothetical protein
MPKKPCHCPNCKGYLRDPKTIKAHSARVESLLAAQRAWRDQNEDARGRAAETPESDGERESDEERSAGLDENAQNDRDIQRYQKRRRTDDNTQVRIVLLIYYIFYLSKRSSKYSRSLK